MPRSTFPGIHTKKVTFSIRNEESVIQGAALGEAGRGWLKVELIWVAESLRGQGFGTKLLAALEAKAIEMGAKTGISRHFQLSSATIL